MCLTSCHDDMLLHDYWLVRLAEKGSVPTACEDSCASLTLFTVTAEISLLAYFSCSPFSDARPRQHHFSCLCVQHISLATCAGVGNGGKLSPMKKELIPILRWILRKDELKLSQKEGKEQYLQWHLRKRWSDVYYLKKKCKKVTNLGLSNGHKQSGRPLFYV